MRVCWPAVVLVAVLWKPAIAEHGPQPGGVLRVAQRAEPRTFNPVTAADAPSREVIRRLHGDLIAIDRSTGQTVANLAETWSVSRDGLTYKLRLRRGVRFSDGQPFTASDVVFSFEAVLDEKTMSPQRDLLLIDGKPVRVSRVDDWTVELRLPKPYAAAERLFDSIAMLPRHKLETALRAGRLREAWTLNTAPAEIVGLGPFRLREYRPGDRITIERNPYFWAAPKPLLDGIEFRFLADEDTQLARFLAGDLDVLNRLNPNAVSLLEAKGAAVADAGPSLEYNFVAFNLSPGAARLKWFDQVAFRRAISLAIDRQALVRLVYQGRAVPLWSQVSPGARQWFDESLPRPPADAAKARNLLRAAGFRESDGRLLDAAGARVEFSLLVSSSSPERRRMAAMIQSDLARIGIGLQVVPLEFRSLLDRVLRTRQFDTCLLGLGGGDADPNSEMNVWLSSESMHLWNPSQRQPATAWEAEIDDLMRRQMTTLDPKARRKLYNRVQHIVAEQAPLVFLASPHVVVAARRTVGNFKPAALDHYTLWNAADLFLRPLKTQ